MEQKMAADVLDRLADAHLEVGCRAFGDGSMTDYLCDLADEIKILRSAKRQFEAEIARLRAALGNLVDACAYVSPIAGAVATEASVKHIRQAGKFMKAVEQAREALGK
jgi:hypothetical protein